MNYNYKAIFTKRWTIYAFGSLIILLALYLSGCVNYDQKTTLKADGSGSMSIHYWTKMSNLSMGTAIGKFDFDEQKAKDNYTSANTTVKSLKVEEKPTEDSTKHVMVELDFKDINKLPDAKGFSEVKPSWKEVADGMELKYTLLKDSSAANNMGASDYKVTYSFEMPSEIVSTNGTKDGQKVSWDYKVSDLGKDIDMTVVVKKPKGKLCGMFGIILGTVVVGFAYSKQRKNKNCKA
jgi:hypothetical protein